MTDRKIPYQSAYRPLPNDMVDTSTGNLFIDSLGTIFMGQTLLMQDLGEKERDNGDIIPQECMWGSLDNREVQMRLHTVFGHLIRELGEAMAHLDGSKSWKDKPRPVNAEEFYEELADSLHFFVEMCIMSGLTSSDLFDRYFDAWRKNNGRQTDGY
jgi:hypothetical protein